MNDIQLQLLITDALIGGINTERLYKATQLAWDDFARHHRDMLFNQDQADAIQKEIGKWRVGK